MNFLNALKERIALILTITSLIGVVFSVYLYFEKRYALAGEVREIKQSVLYMQTEYQRDVTQKRIYDILDRYECESEDLKACKIKIPQTVKEELRGLIDKKARIEERLKKLE